MHKTDLQKISHLLNHGTVEVIVKSELEKKLLSGKKLNVKLGIDPTGADLHIGHMVVVKKLKEFQDLGHNITLLFGNFTGQIGDPTGKKETRKGKSQEELEKNAKHYLDQVKKMLDVSKIKVVWNSDWLSKLDFSDVIKLASNFTVAQMLERDMFQERIKSNAPIALHEFFYPLMQGYDSVAIKADVELGGTDQTFNILAGRVLQKAYGQEPQSIITVPILEGTDGKVKMGKSTGNYIGINESPKEMFGKIMSIPDELITRYFELATDLTTDELIKIKSRLQDGENPRNLKLELAKEIITIYHSKNDALGAEKEFIEIFSNKGLPDEIELVHIPRKEIGLVDLLVETQLCASKSDARRLITQGGVKVNNEKNTDPNCKIDLSTESIIQAGKRKFIKAVAA